MTETAYIIGTQMAAEQASVSARGENQGAAANVLEFILEGNNDAAHMFLFLY